MGIGFVVTCPLESYKNSKEMRGAVSPLRVTLILIVPHLHLKRAGSEAFLAVPTILAHIFQQVPLC